MQTISHHCEVLPFESYFGKFGADAKQYQSIYDNNDTYYLAGKYNPRLMVLKVNEEVPLEASNLATAEAEADPKTPATLAVEELLEKTDEEPEPESEQKRENSKQKHRSKHDPKRTTDLNPETTSTTSTTSTINNGLTITTATENSTISTETLSTAVN